MTTITLTPEIEGPIAEEARRRGTTPETLALESLRRLFARADAFTGSAGGETLFEFLDDHLGTISGTTEALSEHCGGRFTDAMVEKHSRGSS